jgi:hypothetical protein
MNVCMNVWVCMYECVYIYVNINLKIGASQTEVYKNTKPCHLSSGLTKT